MSNIVWRSAYFGCTASRRSRPLEGGTLSREPPRGGSQHPTNQNLPSPLPRKHLGNLSSNPPSPRMTPKGFKGGGLNQT